MLKNIVKTVRKIAFFPLHNISVFSTINLRKEEVFLKKRRNTALFSRILRATLCALGVLFALNFSYAETAGAQLNCNIDDLQSDTRATFVAKWALDEYVITYMDGENEITGLMPASYTIESDSITLPDAPEKIGYTFDGWCDDVELTQNCALNRTIPTGSNGDKTFYAQYTPIEYNISYVLCEQDDFECDSNAIDNTLNQTTYNIEQYVSLNNPSQRTGYTFDGWYDNAEFDGDAVIEIEPGSTIGDKTYYAKWTLIQYNILYYDTEPSDFPDNMPTTFTMLDSDVFVPALQDRIDDGYEFAGWCVGEYNFTCPSPSTTYTISSGTHENVALTAIWRPIVYNIVYDNTSSVDFNLSWVDATPVPYEYTVESEVYIPTPYQESGYIFAGWCVDTDNCVSPITNDLIFPDGELGDKVLYAQWDAEQYNINYVLCPNNDTDCIQNAANNPENRTIYTINDTFDLLPPVRTGYTFVGWYSDNAYINQITRISGQYGDKTLYAKWEKTEYEVLYKCSADEETAVDDYTLTFGDSYSFATIEDGANVCPKPGYTFTGWNCSYVNNENQTIPVEATYISSWNIPYDVVCVPNDWQENSYTITYKSNSYYVTNQNAMATQTCLYSENCVLTQNAYVNPGYNFDGWKRSDGDTVYSDGATITQQLSDITLYAQWSNAQIHCDAGYYLEYGKTSCTVCPKDSFCSGGDYSYNPYSNQGITSCKGYFGSSYTPITDGTGASDVSECYVLCATTSGNYKIDPEHNKIHTGEFSTVVCKYKADIQYVGLNNNEITCANPEYTTMYYSTDNTSVELCVPENIPGRTFIGWTDNKNNQYNISDNPNLTNITIANTVPVDGVVTMIPNWNIEQYTITYQCDNGNVILAEDMEYDDDVELLDYANCNRPGYTLQSWNCDYTGFTENLKMPAQDVECSAITTVNTYNVSFNVNGGNGGQTESVVATFDAPMPTISTIAPTRDGYTFGGWYDAQSGGTQYYTANGESARNWNKITDTVLYARCSPITYTISYTIPYGLTANNRTTYNVETSTFTLINPSKAGYVFHAWCEDEELTQNCTATKTITKGTIGNLNFYADIEEIIYTITYKYVDKDGITHDISDLFDNTYTERTLAQTVILPTDVNIPGYKFIRWYANPNFTGGYITAVLANTATNKVVWAKTEPLSCNANQYINENGGCVACPAHSGSNGGTTTECTCDINYEKSDGACVAKKYTITYEYDGGNVVENPTTYTVETPTTTLNTPTKENHIFTGWYLNRALSGSPITAIPGNLSGNLVLYAGWEYSPCGANQYLQNGLCVACPAHSHTNSANATSCTCDEYYEPDGSNGCSLKTYSINYVYDGGILQGGQTNPTQYTYETPATPLNSPTKEDYTFVEWRLNSINGVAINNISGDLADYGNITLYAKWDRNPNTYILNFKCNSNKNVKRSGYVDATVPLPSATDCEISAGELVSWTCGTQTYNVPGNINIPNTDTTCTPLISYADVEYNIIYKGYDTNGNEINIPSLEPQTYISKNGVLLPNKTNVSVPGYEFNGWYLSYVNSRFTSPVTGFARNSTGDKTVYGKFTTATYKCGMGEYLPANSTRCVPCDESGVYCPGGDFEYSDEPSGKEYCDELYPYSDNGAASTNDCYKHCVSRDYYTVSGHEYSNGINDCVYEPIVYHVYYNTNGGNSIAPSSFTVQDAAIADLPTPQRSDKDFDGWFDAYGFRVNMIDTSIGRDITLYAQWKEKACDENQYKLNGVCTACPANSHGAADGISECECDEGYKKTTVQNVTAYPAEGVKISLNSYNGVNWHTDVVPGTWMYDYADGIAECRSTNGTGQTGEPWVDGNVIEPGKWCWCQMTDPHETKWVYSGYNNGSSCDANCANMCGARSKTNSDLRKALFGNTYTDGAAADMTTVSCELITYNITYIGLEGATNESNPTTYTVEDAGKTIVAPSNRRGYEFAGWTKDGETFTSIPSGMTGDVTLVANWNSKIVRCESGEYLPANSEECVPCVIENAYCPGGDITYSDTDNRIISCGEEYPYANAGATSANQCYKPCDETTGVIYADGTNTCDYTYDIEYVLNGGEFNTDYPQSYEHGVGTLVLAKPYKYGYIFGGWYENPEMVGVSVKNINTNRYGKITLYAKWYFACESGKWLHIGDDDKICLYENKLVLPAMVIETKNGAYYMMLTENADAPIHDGSNKKMRVEIDGRVYNIHDASVITGE